MVGMENLVVRSQDYILRWLPVNPGNTISWSIQPHKKHLNFGIVKRPEATPSVELGELNLTDKDKKKVKVVTGKGDESAAYHTLESKGYKWVQWTGRLDPDKVHMGTFDVREGEGGNYALVFDNTFSKNASKSATIVLMTYPTSAPPTSGHHLHFSQGSAANSTTDVAKGSPSFNPAAASSESIPHDLHSLKSVAADPRPRSKHIVETKSFGGSTFYTGVMLKRRRKHNNYATRFFSLDFTTGTLSYYQNRNSSALRGAIPLALAVITTNETSREINVDSGAETWHLRIKNQKDYDGWRDALDRATSVSAIAASTKSVTQSSSMPPPVVSAAFIRDWERIETLVSKISGIRDAVRRLAKDTDPKYLPSNMYGGRSVGVSPTRSPSEGSFDFTINKEEETPAEKRPFWRRKASGNTPSSSALLTRTGSTGRIPNTSPGPVPMPNGRKASFPGRQYLSTSPDVTDLTGISNIHNHCMEILKDLDETVTSFSSLVAESRIRRQQSRAVTRKNSTASNSSDEFFDAQDGNTTRSQILEIPHDGGDSDKDSFMDATSDTSEDGNEAPTFSRRRTLDEDLALFPPKAKSLVPLPLSDIQRRTQVQPPKQAPPSLIAFLRKNVGKDFANIAMPASANEPTSALQRTAEQLEYSELLDSAAANSDPNMRLLYVTAFAISALSNNRVKERAIRKPFNPMLGETFELVREDKKFRLISEKISHRPVQLAMQADAETWTFLQAAIPTSKFWGKSAELNTQGRARVILHPHSEVYSYTQATSFLRNVIAGEKYVEPVSTMTILCETSGAKAVVTFKAGGMFAGRSEEVSVQSFDNRGIDTGEGLAGKWTSHLNVTSRGQDTGNTIWRVASLLPDASSRYGFTEFAAQMNEITSIEKDHLPVTDSRLRPDQQLLEECKYDEAESVKAKLEERQRQRRRVMEEHGKEWSPRWFYKSGNDGDEDVWRIKSGKEGYWEQRESGKWTNVTDVFETQ